LKDISYEENPSLNIPSTASVADPEYYFGVYEEVIGYNTTYYRAPTELEITFALSERAAEISGKLYLDFSKETRELLSTVALQCENTINEEPCEFQNGRLVTDVEEVQAKTEYTFKIQG